MTIKFTARLDFAIQLLAADKNLKCVAASTKSLFTPLYEGGKYSWLKVMDSDGTLVSFRKVHKGDGSAPEKDTYLTLGVVFQSEDATSQVKANPFGKAALTHIPDGIFASLSDGTRRRLDRLIVVFVLPQGTTPDHIRKFNRARKYVMNASKLMPNVVTVQVPRGGSSATIAQQLKTEIRPFLTGAGRPRSEM